MKMDDTRYNVLFNAKIITWYSALAFVATLYFCFYRKSSYVQSFFSKVNLGLWDKVLYSVWQGNKSGWVDSYNKLLGF
jgi:hypothetical protein